MAALVDDVAGATTAERPGHVVRFDRQVCLSMIVRNEAAVIARCLASVRPAIGAWAIVDTGSTDGTQAIVRETLKDLPGELIQREWVDFATNRNQALALAKRYGTYALILDADDVLEIAPRVEPRRLTGAGYFVRQCLDGTEFEYHSAKLLRLDQPWRWEGVIHEVPMLEPPPLMQQVEGLRVRSYPDGARSRRPAAEKYLDDVRVLEAALEREPENTRYRFYHAQSLRDGGETERALDAYRLRARLGGWDEEVAQSRLQIAMLSERLQAAPSEVVDAYVTAWECRPTRAEALCELARYLRILGRHALAHLYAERAAQIPEPGDRLFVDLSVYRWRARDELGLALWNLGRRAEAAAIFRSLLADARLPANERPRVTQNLAFC